MVKQVELAGQFLHIGTHRRAHRADPQDIAHGIYTYAADASGRVGALVQMTPTAQPGWLALHPRGNALYSVNEVRSGEAAGVSAFAINAQNGALELLGFMPTPAMPCHCAVDATGRFLLVATFGGGSVHLFRLAADGAIIGECDTHIHAGSSSHPVRQTAPHAHAVAIRPDNRLVFVPDLGTDRVLVYALDTAQGRLVPLPDAAISLPPLSGPRHMAFSADGGQAFLINEMSATVQSFSLHESGKTTLLQTIDLLPEGFAGQRSGAAIVVSPCGRWLYATTRSHGSSGLPDAPGLDQLAWFAIDRPTGMLEKCGTVPSGGGIPRAITLSPDGSALLVAHQCSGSIVRFALDPATGQPAPVGEFATPVPVAMLFSAPE